MDVRRPTILVVDDDPVIVDLISSLLEEDYSVLAAYDGRDALQLLKKQRPDLLLLDLMMPGVDGFTVARQVREKYEDHQLPVLILSAHPSLHAQTRDLGVNGFLTKPFEPEDLVQRVAQLV